MPKILVINSGSTSVKYKLFNENGKNLKDGYLNNVKDFNTAIKSIIRKIGSLHDLIAIGHRVVHGGDKFFKSILINKNILNVLERFNHLAPLHNPYNLAGIKIFLEFLPNIPQIAVFDTAFYFELPEVAKAYALPKNIVKKYNIKRFGFHGISHEYAMNEVSRKFKKNINNINLIICHLGGGWSATAIKKGKPIDTSMGYTPLEGLIMMTRSGDIDSGIVLELVKNSKFSSIDDAVEEVKNILIYKSGILGLSQGVNNYQKLLKEISNGNKIAKLAFDIAVYKLIKYIGAYWAILNGKVNAIVFTGSIGAGDQITRNTVMSKLKFLKDVRVLSIKANEEIMIMQEVKKLMKMA